jgi:short-subunit dehydrogenase
MVKSPEVVVITGASAGIGRAAALEFAKSGAKIALLARNQEALAETAREIERLGGTAITLPVDISDPEQVEAAAAETENRLGPVDIWVNNAMTSILAPFKDITPAEYKRITEVTYLGFVYGTMAALKRMSPRNRGTIVQVNSALSYRGVPLQSAYCGAKHASKGFTESLRAELIHDGIKVHISSVLLSAINTPLYDWMKNKMPERAHPILPVYQPEVAAQAIYWAAHHRRREIVVGRSAWFSIFANKFVPGLIDKGLALIGYNAQQAGCPKDVQQPDNLFSSPQQDHRVHGSFDAKARNLSLTFWLGRAKPFLPAVLFLGLILGKNSNWFKRGLKILPISEKFKI